MIRIYIKKYLLLPTLFLLTLIDSSCSDELSLKSTNYLKAQIIILSFEKFKNIFSNTKNLPDFQRSMNKIEAKYGMEFKINELHKYNFEKLSTLNYLVDSIFIEVIKKAKFESNSFFNELQIFLKEITSIRKFYEAELKLVQLKQEYFNIENKFKNTVKTNQFKANELYVNHLVDTIRYEIFIKYLNLNPKFRNSKIKNHIQSKPLKNE